MKKLLSWFVCILFVGCTAEREVYVLSWDHNTVDPRYYYRLPPLPEHLAKLVAAPGDYIVSEDSLVRDDPASVSTRN